MSTPDEIRARIKKELDERGISMASASIAIGKNAAYLQQYIVKGSPIRLPEEQRKRLSIILEIPEQELTDRPIIKIPMPSAFEGINMVANTIGGLFAPKPTPSDTVTIDMYDITACCGNGIENVTENVIGKWSMSLLDFKKISSTAPENVKLIKVKGDSMFPTLKEDDWVMVDTNQNYPSDGMFLLRLAGNFLTVKRIQCALGNNLTILSDNPNYQPMNASVEDVAIVGKVIYALKTEKFG